MSVTTQRHHGAQHREPQEQEVGQLIGPEQRTVEYVTRHHTGEQDQGLGHDDRRADTLRDQTDAAVQQKGGMAQSGTIGGFKSVRGGHTHGHAGDLPQASGPEYFSSNPQASSPIFFFIST